MRMVRRLHGTRRVGEVSGQWAVVQQEAEVDGKQTNGELG